MEVVLLVVGISGIALLAMSRVIQRRSSCARPTARRPRWRRPARRRAPPHVGDLEAQSARRRERLGRRSRLGGRGDRAQARDVGARGARASRRPLPAEPAQEAPSAERWQEDDDWSEEDSGWDVPGAGGNGNGNGHVEPSQWTAGREWTTREDGPTPEPAVAGASASAATDVAAEPRTYALQDAEWDEEPAERPWGAPVPQPSPEPDARRKLHPVLLLAIYAAAGIGLVVLASTMLLGGSADPAPPKPASTPAPVRTPEPTPEATGSVADDTAALEEARKAEAAARRAFRGERTRALAARRRAVDRAEAAARREQRADRIEREGRNDSNPAPSGGGAAGSGLGGSGLGGSGTGGGAGGGGRLRRWRWSRRLRRRWRRRARGL